MLEASQVTSNFKPLNVAVLSRRCSPMHVCSLLLVTTFLFQAMANNQRETSIHRLHSDCLDLLFTDLF